MRKFLRVSAAWLAIGFAAAQAEAGSWSFADRVVEATGISADDASVALGAPDYAYANGTFLEGAAVVFGFPAPIDDVPGADLFLYAFVTATGPDTSTVRIEGRSEPSDAFVEIATIDTADARVASSQNSFSQYTHVHEFRIDFAELARKVSEVRITNVAGAPLALDALEAVHPALSAPDYAVEIRIFRLRDDESKRFALRFKNISRLPLGDPMTGFSIAHTTGAYIDQTDKPVVGENGQFDATPETAAGPDNGDHTQRTEYVWSVADEGLNPGESASHTGTFTIDTDLPGDEYLENLLFGVTFLDGSSSSADFADLSADGEQGQLFSLYPRPPASPSIFGPRPVVYYEFFVGAVVPEPLCTDCGQPGNDNENTNANDNTDDPTPPAPPMCSAGMIGPFFLAPLAWPFLSRGRRFRAPPSPDDRLVVENPFDA